MVLQREKRILGWLLFCMAVTQPAVAQFSIGAQLRTRSELRDGQGAPLPKDSKAAFFTSQRTRLMFGYNAYRIKLGVTVQDVRVWGQDVSTVNRTTTQDNNAILLHEAWAEIGLTDTTNKKENLSLKVGRQELVYDDHRLLGNLDWLQQGRRHDAAVLKYNTGNWNLHAGFAFNQNKENASGTKYSNTPPGNYPGNTNAGTIYKSMEFLYAGKKLKQGSVSFLFFADQFSQYHNETINNVPTKVWDNGSWGRYTTGIYITNNFNKLNVTGSAYYQAGKTAAGQELSAGLVSLATAYSFSTKFSAGPGADITTGGNSATKSNAFDPLYGTPHKFWGLMDYFYVANSFGNKGLADYYIKTKYKASTALQLTADLHQFAATSNIYAANNTKLKRSFGTEADVTALYTLTKNIGFEMGYSHFFSTATLASPTVKNVFNSKNNSNWAYLMVNIKI